MKDSEAFMSFCQNMRSCSECRYGQLQQLGACRQAFMKDYSAAVCSGHDSHRRSGTVAHDSHRRSGTVAHDIEGDIAPEDFGGVELPEACSRFRDRLLAARGVLDLLVASLDHAAYAEMSDAVQMTGAVVRLLERDYRDFWRAYTAWRGGSR